MRTHPLNVSTCSIAVAAPSQIEVLAFAMDRIYKARAKSQVYQATALESVGLKMKN